MPEWATSTPFLIASGALSVGLFVGTLLAIPFLCARLPEDYFVRPVPKRSLAAVLGRSLIALVLIAAGIAMLVLPGQGLLTILVGLSFLDFAAKRRAERFLLTRPQVLGTINRFRARMKKPPLLVP